ncbi:MAG: two-component regulator propeller domain-containing protein [Verrucomicrobiales bacterium]|nr:two-component regulator propeller domain-containing protein [Verrucomicrobiales bacterium]
MLPAQESSTKIRFSTLAADTPGGGISSDHVQGIVQDLSGYVWIATDKGLNRFDGWVVTKYNESDLPETGLSSDLLTCVATTRNPSVSANRSRSIWVGTSSEGLIQFESRSGKSTWIRKSAPNAGSLLSNEIVDIEIAEDKTLWIGTRLGLNRLDLETGEITTVEGDLANLRIASISILPATLPARISARNDTNVAIQSSNTNYSDVWVGTSDGGLYSLDSNTGEFTRRLKLTAPIESVVKDADDILWIATAGLGLQKLLPGESTPIRVEALEAANITALLVDSNHDLWVGTLNGLAQYDSASETFTLLQHNSRDGSSLNSNQISALYEHRLSRILWVATKGGGTSRFSLDREWFSHIRSTPSKGLSLPHPAVRTLEKDTDGNLLAGTDLGLALWIPKTEQFKAPSAELATIKASIRDIHLDFDKNLWIGTQGEGLIRRKNDGTVTTFRHDSGNPASLPHDNVSSIIEAASEEVFIGTHGGGIAMIDREKDLFIPIEGPGRNEADFVISMSRSADGQLWIAAESGIYILPPGAKKLVSFSEAFPQAEPFNSKQINVIYPDANSVVWFGTEDAGVDRFNLVTGEITNYNAAVHGLPDDNVTSITQDKFGALWIGTYSGIARLNGPQTEFRVFAEDDGLQQSGFSYNAVEKDLSGQLYFGGQDGFNIIDPSNLPDTPRAPTPILTQFGYFGQIQIPGEDSILKKPLASTSKLTLPADPRTRFTIGFGDLDFRFPNRGKFEYMLQPVEKYWQPADIDRRASYANLEPGTYQFQARSSLDGKTWSQTTAKISITIPRPWYQTWWFRGLAAFLIIAGITGITRYIIRSRVKQLQRREEGLRADRDKAEAALARQLQNRLLIERTTRDLHNEVQEDLVLNEALQTITTQFGATHCLVHRVITEATDDGNKTEALKPVGYFSTFEGESIGAQTSLERETTLIQRILASNSVVSTSDIDEIPSSITQAFPAGASISILGSKTSFLEEANGCVTFLRVNGERDWTSDDVKLLEALTGQFGIAIAQLNTAAIEAEYQQHLEDARHEAEVANRAKSDFLAKMTHELRTPLNAIIGFSEILGEDKTLNPKQRETLDIINNSGEHLLDVINEILDLSKIEAGKMERNDETFSFVPMLKSVYEMLAMKADGKRIGFNFAAGSQMPGEIVSDRSKIRQILINLIGNAIKFTAQGAVSLSIKAVAKSEPVEFEGRLRRKIRIQFEVRDTGKGISDNEIERLFERYSQTESGRRSSEGTGLGLPIARSFVQLLGGDVEVESHIGEGTVFRFYIECDELAPAEEGTRQASLALDESTAQKIRGFNSAHDEVRILIAEDQPTNRLLLKKILGKAGFKMEEVENGEEAVKAWHDWKPHLILMDEDMPVMKGSDAAREITALTKPGEETVIVSLTAYALEQAKLKAIDAGCTDFVAKPFRSHELFSVISKHLGIEYIFEGDEVA